MRIGIIIPDRGDRQEFMNNCSRMLYKQDAYKYHEIFVCLVDASELTPTEKVDIVPRIRIGYHHISKKYDVDVIAIIENDDWYSDQYLNYMVQQWDKHGRPDLFGTSYTIYYHMKFKAYYQFHHSQRASLMNTLIKPGLDFSWPDSEENPYLDIHLWNDIKNKIIFVPDKHYSIGMKHGIGKCGGGMHEDDKMNRLRYPNADTDSDFLKENIDSDSFNFYTNYFK